MPAPQIGTRFVLRTSIAGHEQTGRTLWIDLRRADIALMADMPAVPDPEDLVELIEAVERDGLRAIIRYELADGALTQSGRPIAMLRAIELGAEWGARIPIGVFYENPLVPTFGDRIEQRNPAYTKEPPARQKVADAQGASNIDFEAVTKRLKV